MENPTKMDDLGLGGNFRKPQKRGKPWWTDLSSPQDEGSFSNQDAAREQREIDALRKEVGQVASSMLTFRENEQFSREDHHF